MNEKFDLAEKTVLVTGGGRGLGEAISRRLARAGANVMVADQNIESVETVVGQIREMGGRATAFLMDASDPKSVDETVFKVVSLAGGLDVLINNAGGDKTLSHEELKVEAWKRIVDVSLTGPFLMSERVVPILREQGGGHIVNIMSPQASKWGLLGFSHALHTEARAMGVKVTAVICGGVRTSFRLEPFPDLDRDNLQEPADVAELIHFVLTAPRGMVIPEITVLPRNRVNNGEDE